MKKIDKLVLLLPFTFFSCIISLTNCLYELQRDNCSIPNFEYSHDTSKFPQILCMLAIPGTASTNFENVLSNLLPYRSYDIIHMPDVCIFGCTKDLITHTLPFINNKVDDQSDLVDTNQWTASRRLKEVLQGLQWGGRHHVNLKNTINKVKHLTQGNLNPIWIKFHKHLVNKSKSSPLLKGNILIFTILRESYSRSLKQWRMRSVWDKHKSMPHGFIKEISLRDWVIHAYWRMNIFTQSLAGVGENIWTFGNPGGSQSRQEILRQNRMGYKSQWLQDAMTNLSKMPFFGIFHRLKETMELMAFTFCFKMQHSILKNTRSNPRDIVLLNNTERGEEIYYTVQKYNRLDILLMEYAEELFDEKIKAMRNAKSQGIFCQIDSWYGSECGLYYKNFENI